MERTVYEAPVTERFSVELEGSFCGAANVQNPEGNNGEINEHEINTDFGGDFSNEAWDQQLEN